MLHYKYLFQSKRRAEVCKNDISLFFLRNIITCQKMRGGGIMDKDMSKLQNERYEEEQNEENVSNTL